MKKLAGFLDNSSVKPLRAGIFDYLNDKLYILFLVLTALGSYGFMITHYSVSADDLQYNTYYFKYELLAQERFSSTVFMRFFGLADNLFWLPDLLGIVFLSFSVILFCVIFDMFIKTENHIPQTVFSCLFISNPLHSELFSYSDCSISVGLGSVIIALSIYLLIKGIEIKKIRYAFFATLLLIFVSSLYESVIPIYIEVFLFIIILKCVPDYKIKFKDFILYCIYFAVPLAASVVLEAIISRLVRILMHIDKSNLNKVFFEWNFFHPAKFLFQLKYKFFDSLFDVFKSFFYFPMAVFWAALFIFMIFMLVHSIKRKSICLFISYSGIIFAVFILQFMFGEMIYRTCQSFSFFTALTAYLIIAFAFNGKASAKKIISNTIVCAASALILLQVSKINYFFSTDYERYLYEKKETVSIAQKIEEDFDKNKPIVFVGSFDFNDYLKNKAYIKTDDSRLVLLRKIPIIETICSNRINDSEYAFKIQQTNCISYLNYGINCALEERPIEEFLSFCGYDDLKYASRDECKKVKEQIDDNMPAWPQEGSIKEIGDYTVVNFGKSGLYYKLH